MWRIIEPEKPEQFAGTNPYFFIMTKSATKIPIASIILDESIYPRKAIDHRRVGMFAEHIRDGFKFDPIEVEPVPRRTRQISPPRWGAQMERLQVSGGHRNRSNHNKP